MVLFLFNNTRLSMKYFTALNKTILSTSLPAATISEEDVTWVTLATSCSMIGPSSKSEVTKCAVAPMSFTPLL